MKIIAQNKVSKNIQINKHKLNKLMKSNKMY